MKKNSSKEKKQLKFRIKTFADFKRFTSKQLNNIVEKFRTNNKELTNLSLEELLEKQKFVGAMKAVVRQSLVNRADKSKEVTKKRMIQNIKELKEQNTANEEKFQNKEISEKEHEKASRKIEYQAYKIDKEIYTKNLGAKDQEKPKNPVIQRSIKNVKNAAKVVGKGIVKGASIAAGAVAFPFVIAYKGAKAGVKAIGRGAKMLKRGATVASLTAGKVAGNVKEQVQTAKIQVKREMYENANEEEKKEILTNDHIAALKENAKREREAARRESLHMDKNEQTINHEKAIERVEGEILTPEEIKKVYGEQEK